MYRILLNISSGRSLNGVNMLLQKSFLILLLFFCHSTLVAQVDTAWTYRYNGLSDSTEEISDIAVDNLGNVYTTGFSYNELTKDDYITIKLTQNGDTAWLRQYNGPDDNNDRAFAIAVDDLGYVYVTGESWISGVYSEYATIKYNPNGDTVWVRRYHDSTTSEGNGAHDIDIDDNYNIYITGGSTSLLGYTDIATIKYIPDGSLGWLRRYNSPFSSVDWAHSMDFDDNYNIYITGHSYGSGSWDFITLKYDSSGVIQWDKRYNGSDNGDDVAWDVVLS